MRDVYCARCRVQMGWAYEFAHDLDQKYKEGHVILEKSLTSIIQEHDPKLSMDVSPRSHCGDYAMIAPAALVSPQTYT